MQKNSYPIVICYNGRDHFVPTIQTLEKDFLSWKIHRKFGSLLAATLLVAKECDRPGVPAATALSIKAVTNCLETHLPKISKPSHTYYLQLRAKKGQTYRGPGVNPAGSTIPGGPTPSSDPPQSSSAPSTSATSGHSDPAPVASAEAEEEQESNIKGYKLPTLWHY